MHLAIPESTQGVSGKQENLAIPESTQGVSGKQESLSAAAMVEVLQSHQDLPLLRPGLGATGIKETSLPGS